jgi:hypothetical protein
MANNTSSTVPLIDLTDLDQDTYLAELNAIHDDLSVMQTSLASLPSFEFPCISRAQSASGPRVTPLPGVNKPRRNRRQAGQRLSRFVFTLNNYTREEEDAIKATDVTWLCFGHETGDNGTPHLQGACVIGSQVAFSTVKNWPGFARCHIESMRGKPEDSRTYCSKQDKTAFFEKGLMPQPGKRNDLHTAIEVLRSGRSVQQLIVEEDVAVVATVARYPKGLQLISDALTPPRSCEPIILWISGPTGVGKTRASVQLADTLGLEYWIANGSFQWFDGYRGQPLVIADDYRTKFSSFQFLLRLLDRYRLDVPVKGAYVRWNPYIIIVTAPASPTSMWNLRSDEDLKQLSRRCHLIQSFDAPGEDHTTIHAALEKAIVSRWPNELYPWQPQGDSSSECSAATAELHGGDLSGERISVELEISSEQDKSCTTTEEFPPATPPSRTWKYHQELSDDEAARSTASTMSF